MAKKKKSELNTNWGKFSVPFKVKKKKPQKFLKSNEARRGVVDVSDAAKDPIKDVKKQLFNKFLDDIAGINNE